MTSGGSESLLLAVRGGSRLGTSEPPARHGPEVLLPVTAHPALLKAAHIVGVEPVIVPVTDTFAANVEAARALVTDDTILVVGSALVSARRHGSRLASLRSSQRREASFATSTRASADSSSVAREAGARDSSVRFPGTWRHLDIGRSP